MSDAEKWADMIKEAGEPPTSRNLVTKLREYGGFDAAEDPTTSARSGVMTQYSPDGNKFYATGSTVPTLPPGVYAARVESRGVLFEKKSLAFDELLRLPDTRSDEVVEEIRRFWGLKEAFRAHGFVHKRGFLLFGPQGGGKTCTAMAVTPQLTDQPKGMSALLCGRLDAVTMKFSTKRCQRGPVRMAPYGDDARHTERYRSVLRRRLNRGFCANAGTRPDRAALIVRG